MLLTPRNASQHQSYHNRFYKRAPEIFQQLFGGVWRCYGDRLCQRDISQDRVCHGRRLAVMADYKEAPLATRPKTLDPKEYFNLSPESRRAEAERLSLRANLKRQYLLQLNNPHRKELIVSAS